MADTLAEAMAQATTEDAGYDVLTISNDLRTIAVPADFVLGVYQDEDVHRVYFKMPRMYGETDLSKYSTVRINYQNANGEGDYYTVEDKTADEDSITFSWLVGRFAFASAGQVKFSVCIRLVDSAGTVTNEFNTTVVEVPVLEGLETDAALDVAVQDAMIRAENAAERAEKAAGTVEGGGTTYTFSDDTVTAANGDVQAVTVTKVNGHTVEADVPADAVFTDTVYDDTALSAKVSANTKALGGHTLGMDVPAGSKLTDTVYDDTAVRKLIAGKQDILTFDSTPTADSTNPVTSGGVKAYVDSKAGGGSSGGSSDVIQNTAWTALASGTFTSGTAAFADFDTGVTWKDLNTYKFINIIVTSSSATTEGNYFVSVVSNSPGWNRIMFAIGRGSVIFLKLKDFFWTPVYVLQQGSSTYPPQVGYSNAWLHQAKTYSSFGNIYNFTNYANSKIYFGNTADLTTDASWGIFGI